MERLVVFDILFGAAYLLLNIGSRESFGWAIATVLLLISIRLAATHFSHWYFFLLIIPFVISPAATRIELGALTVFYALIYILFQGTIRRNEELEQRQIELERSLSSMKQQRIQQRQLDEELRYASRLEERNQMSQRIHDLVGHSLSGALLQLEVAQRVVDSRPDETRHLISDSAEIIRGGIDEIRQVLREAKPEQRELGLARVRAILDEFTGQTQIRSQLVTSGALDRITSSHWVVIQANVQEALSNTARHSTANLVMVHLDVFARFIRLVIHDDGQGAAVVRKGMGMMGMEERVANIGGTVTFDGSRGMRVTTVLPLEIRTAVATEGAADE